MDPIVVIGIDVGLGPDGENALECGNTVGVELGAGFGLAAGRGYAMTVGSGSGPKVRFPGADWDICAVCPKGNDQDSGESDGPLRRLGG